MGYHYVTMSRTNKRKQESDSVLETLRIERTQLSQDELAAKCGIPRATYMRWIAGKTEARPTLPQLKKLCKELGINHIDELPDDFGPQN
ncbi:transcriptional regulator [[Phormidium ambiguum] IAM M-71]|uniref:Transcriptional regulator n=2 Tax=[Phormidium ambiguum] IAM M-71 TaxID=454136 RepID=A0A1U7IM88_9CYAN|nr:transcriptional regulator [Phormidium ambiguum IAM M-71]